MEIYVGKHMPLKDAESVYDQMYAEFFGDRKKTRKKPDARTRAERLADWEQEKQSRKDRKWDRDWELYNRDWKARSDYMSHAERKIRYAEKLARADWELESAAIAEDKEWERFNAELFEFDRQWREQAEEEERKMREYRKMRELNEWLKYA